MTFTTTIPLFKHAGRISNENYVRSILLGILGTQSVMKCRGRDSVIPFMQAKHTRRPHLRNLTRCPCWCTSTRGTIHTGHFGNVYSEFGVDCALHFFFDLRREASWSHNTSSNRTLVRWSSRSSLCMRWLWSISRSKAALGWVPVYDLGSSIAISLQASSLARSDRSLGVELLVGDVLLSTCSI